MIAVVVHTIDTVIALAATLQNPVHHISDAPTRAVGKADVFNTVFTAIKVISNRQPVAISNIQNQVINRSARAARKLNLRCADTRTKSNGVTL